MAKRRKLPSKLSKANLAESDALLREVGLVVVTVAHLENTLSWIFGHLSKPVQKDDSSAYFHSLQTFERRLELTNFVIRKECTPETISKWQKIYDGIHQHRKKRNVVAHQGLVHSFDIDQKFEGAFLMEPWFKQTASRTKLSLLDVKSVAGALNKVHGELWKFAMALPGSG